MRQHFSIALILLLLLGTLRGGATSISKYVSINDVPPLAYAMWQSGIAAVLMGFMCLLAGKKLPDFRRHFGFFSACAVLGTAVPNVVFFYVVQVVGAGTMAVLLTFVPIFTCLLVVLLGVEKIGGKRLLGVTLGFAGALIIALPGNPAQLDVDIYVLIGLICPAGYALMSVLIARGPLKGEHAYTLVAGTHFLSACYLLPAVFIADDFYPIWSEPSRVEFLIVVHAVIAAIAYTLFFKIVQLAGPVFYSFSTYIIAVCGLAWAWVIFGETHGGYFWVAVALIFLGLALVNLQQHRYQTGAKTVRH